MEKENNTIKFIYNKEEFSFKITSDSNLNYLYIKDLIINKFQIKIPEEKEIYIYYIDQEFPDEKIMISNDEDLNNIIEKHKQFTANEAIIIQIYLFEKDNEKDFTNSSIFPSILQLKQKNQNNITKSNINNNNLNELNNSWELYENLELCNYCNKTLGKNMFTCLICDNYFLCDKCFFKHSNQHPMFVITKGLNSHFIQSQNDIFFFVDNKNKKDDKVYDLRLDIPSHKRYFYMPFCFQRKIQLIIQNKGNKIKFPVFVLVKNSKGLEIKTNYFSYLKKNECTEVFIEIKNNDKTEKIYSLDILLFAKDKKIKFNKISLTVGVTSEEKANNENIKIFKKYNNISKWSKDIQIYLFDEFFDDNIKVNLKELNETNHEIDSIEDLYALISPFKE